MKTFNESLYILFVVLGAYSGVIIGILVARYIFNR